MRILIVTMINKLHEKGVLELAILTSVLSQQIIIRIIKQYNIKQTMTYLGVSFLQVI